MVTAVDAENHGLVLDRTAFYRSGGGHPHDLSTLTFNGQIYAIKHANRIGGQIIYLLPGDAPLPQWARKSMVNWIGSAATN